MTAQQHTLGELIERHLITIDASRPSSYALRLARTQQIHHLPVFAGSTLVGLVCTCDMEEAPVDGEVADWTMEQSLGAIPRLVHLLSASDPHAAC